jgi:putative N6-adenine-specific DNA methylase
VTHGVAASRDSDVLPVFVITAPGLEEIAAAELRALGISRPVVEAGGVEFGGTHRDVHEANLWLRTASRVVIRIARFHASEFHELERRAKRVPWQHYIGTPSRVRFRVTCRKSKLYHSDAVAERLAKTIERVHGLSGGFAIAAGDDAGEDAASAPDEAQLFIVRLAHDEVTISADTSGALLHRRGYRQAVAKAPLRETLAAAMVVGSGWDAVAPFADPMCGSGTIPIEAAMIARTMAPGIDHVAGRSRQFAFMNWPGFDDHAWADRVAAARDGVTASAPAPILGADRDAGAIQAARANADRAGVGGDIEWREQSVSALELPEAPGWIVSNPPYGVRVGESAPLRNLYAQLGKVARDRARGWTLVLLSADRALEGQVGIRFADVLRTSNGGIPVRLVRGVVR